MARGQSAAADSQRNLTNSVAAGSGTQANQIMGMELPVIQGQLQNPGYDPVTQAAIRRSGMDTVNTAYDASKFSAAQRAGATGNDAMFYGSNADLASKRAGALSTASTGAEVEIGKQKLASQQQAITDASQLYGFNSKAMTDLYGTGAEALKARAAGPSGDQAALGYLNWTTGGKAG
jgi:hypothetical protein